MSFTSEYEKCEKELATLYKEANKQLEELCSGKIVITDAEWQLNYSWMGKCGARAIIGNPFSHHFAPIHLKAEDLDVPVFVPYRIANVNIYQENLLRVVEDMIEKENHYAGFSRKINDEERIHFLPALRELMDIHLYDPRDRVFEIRRIDEDTLELLKMRHLERLYELKHINRSI